VPGASGSGSVRFVLLHSVRSFMLRAHFSTCAVVGLAVLFVVVSCGGATAEDGGSGGDSGRAGSGGSGVAIDFFACSHNEECIVFPKDSCGACDAIAINQGHAIDYANQVRGDACVGADPRCYILPTLVATCAGAKCTLVDISAHPLTACTSDSECRIRTNDCCECAGATGVNALIAIRVDADQTFQSLACHQQVCPECAPLYPSDVRAICEAGHCKAWWGG
jgi:hypothetical protein